MATLKLSNKVLGGNNPAVFDLAHYVCSPTGIAGFDRCIFLPAMSATLNRQPDMAKSNSKGSQSPFSPRGRGGIYSRSSVTTYKNGACTLNFVFAGTDTRKATSLV